METVIGHGWGGDKRPTHTPPTYRSCRIGVDVGTSGVEVTRSEVRCEDVDEWWNLHGTALERRDTECKIGIGVERQERERERVK